MLFLKEKIKIKHNIVLPRIYKKAECEGSVSMSAREQVLMNIIGNLRRFGVDISNSKFKDKDIENEVVMTVYIKDVREYMVCYDFIRLERTLNNTQWSAAFTSITRLEERARELGINSFLKPFDGIRDAIIQKNIRSAKQSLAVFNNKKSQILKYLG